MRKMLLVVTTMLLAENSHAKRKRTSPHMRMQTDTSTSKH